MTIHRTPYFGLGIVFAPKSEYFVAHIIINFLVWEINIQWGKQSHV